jgi:hypothetical protein
MSAQPWSSLASVVAYRIRDPLWAVRILSMRILCMRILDIRPGPPAGRTCGHEGRQAVLGGPGLVRMEGRNRAVGASLWTSPGIRTLRAATARPGWGRPAGRCRTPGLVRTASRNRAVSASGRRSPGTGIRVGPKSRVIDSHQPGAFMALAQPARLGAHAGPRA